jgi:hypothetical protein
MFYIKWTDNRTRWFDTIGEVRDFLEENYLLSIAFTRVSSREEKIDIAKEAIRQAGGELIER